MDRSSGITIAEWRNKHRKCKWCEHCEFISPSKMHYIPCPDFYQCAAKDKIVHENLPRPFCRAFTLKEM